MVCLYALKKPVIAIALIAKDASKNWKIRIGPALIAVCSTELSTIGYFLQFLMFGRKMRLPADTFHKSRMTSPKPVLQSKADYKKTLKHVPKTLQISIMLNQNRQ